MQADDLGDARTIAAIATPPGRGALAVVRLSGRDAFTIGQTILRPHPTAVRRAALCTVHAADGSVIDQVVVTMFAAPHSFTGEDILEITTHGGAIVPTAVLATVVDAGARIAERGEFTRRAVINGKLDLLQAEAIGGLIDAGSSAAHKQALRQLDGGLSRRIDEFRVQIIALEALLAYDIDFPEEDDGPIPRERIIRAAEDLIVSLETLLVTGAQGALVHQGALVVLAGAPNVGKSSLFNALLGEARAIVTEVPGTTRDAIEAVLDLPGWPVRLVDTAGMHAATDVVERLGIEASSRYLRHADIVLACVEASTGPVLHHGLHSHTDAPIIMVATKADLVTNSSYIGDVAVSANTGSGLTALLALITDRLESLHGTLHLDAPLLTRARHRAAVQTARDDIGQFLTAWRDENLPSSVAATYLHDGVAALSGLIGTVHTDDILDVVFRSFCVGK